MAGLVQMFPISEEERPDSYDSRLAALENMVEQLTIDSKLKHDRLKTMLDTTTSEFNGRLEDAEASMMTLGKNIVLYQADLVKILGKELEGMTKKMKDQEQENKKHLDGIVQEAAHAAAAASLSSSRQQMMQAANVMRDGLSSVDGLTQCIRDTIVEKSKEEHSTMEVARALSTTKELSVTQDIDAAYTDLKLHMEETQKSLVEMEAGKPNYKACQTVVQTLMAKIRSSLPDPINTASGEDTPGGPSRPDAKVRSSTPFTFSMSGENLAAVKSNGSPPSPAHSPPPSARHAALAPGRRSMSPHAVAIAPPKAATASLTAPDLSPTASAGQAGQASPRSMSGSSSLKLSANRYTSPMARWGSAMLPMPPAGDNKGSLTVPSQRSPLTCTSQRSVSMDGKVAAQQAEKMSPQWQRSRSTSSARTCSQTQMAPPLALRNRLQQQPS